VTPTAVEPAVDQPIAEIERAGAGHVDAAVARAKAALLRPAFISPAG
jgi:hypothetical protein